MLDAGVTSNNDLCRGIKLLLDRLDLDQKVDVVRKDVRTKGHPPIGCARP
jgi:hypothetical protein